MRIVHVIDSLDPALGGPPMSTAGLAAAQASLGHDVVIFCHESPGRDDEVRSSMSRIPGIDKVSMVSCPIGNISNKLMGFQDRKCFENIIDGIDVIHIHGLWRPILKAVCGMARRAGIHYLIAPRGMMHPWALGHKKWKKKIAMRAGWKKSLENASLLHVLNKDEASHIRSLDLRVNIKVIPNGIFPAQMDNLPSGSEFYDSHHELNRRPYILFLGRLHYVKGLDILADAFSVFACANKQVDLVIAGPDSGERNGFERRINALGLDGRVHLVGPLYGVDKFAALAGASCYCQPSRQEGFSMAITEAMACGLPVVISRNCNFPEVEEACAGKVVDLNAEAVGNALLHILENNKRREGIGKNARDLVLSRYTWPQIAEQTIEAYRCALDGVCHH